MAVARSMAQREFILSCDKELPTEEQTIFFVNPLSSDDEIVISDMLSKSEGMYTEVIVEKGEGKEYEKRTHRSPIPANYIEKRDATVARSLIGWKNYKDENGNSLDFAALTPKERVERLYPSWRDELSTFIDSLNYPTEAALKN